MLQKHIQRSDAIIYMIIGIESQLWLDVVLSFV